MNSLVNGVADLMAPFSPDAAQAYRSKPFHRLAVAMAFTSGFERQDAFTADVCAMAMHVAELDRQSRAASADNSEEA